MDRRVRSRARPGPPDRPDLLGPRVHPDHKGRPARRGGAQAAEEQDPRAHRASRARPAQRENRDLRALRATTGLQI